MRDTGEVSFPCSRHFYIFLLIPLVILGVSINISFFYRYQNCVKETKTLTNITHSRWQNQNLIPDLPSPETNASFHRECCLCSEKAPKSSSAGKKCALENLPEACSKQWLSWEQPGTIYKG